MQGLSKDIQFCNETDEQNIFTINESKEFTKKPRYNATTDTNSENEFTCHKYRLYNTNVAHAHVYAVLPLFPSNLNNIQCFQLREATFVAYS